MKSVDMFLIWLKHNKTNNETVVKNMQSSNKKQKFFYLTEVFPVCVCGSNSLDIVLILW